MKVLVLNCGSSSIKYKLFDMDHKEVIAQGGIEKIGLKGSFLKLTLPDGGKKILEKDIPEHTVGVEFILNTLISPEYGAIKSLDEINAVGHRMVHGGEKFRGSHNGEPRISYTVRKERHTDRHNRASSDGKRYQTRQSAEHRAEWRK